MSHEMDNQGRIGTAAEWFVDVDAEALDAATESEFEEWLASDAENESALARCEAAAQAAAFLEHDPELRWAYDDIDAFVKQTERQPSNRARVWFMRPRFAWFFPGLAAICIAVVFVTYDRSRTVTEDTLPASGLLMGDTLAPGSLPDPTVVIPVDSLLNSTDVLPVDNLSPNLAEESTELSGVVEIQSDIARSVTQTSGAAVATSNTLQDNSGDAAALVPDRNLVWVDRDGREAYVMAPARPYTGIRLSPDGQRVAATILDYDDATQQAREDVWVLDLSFQTMARLTFDGGPNAAPVWTPDGQSIVYGAGGSAGIFVAWVPDGQRIIYRVSGTDEYGIVRPPDGQLEYRIGGSAPGILQRSADGSGVPIRLTAASTARGHFPSALSPDGALLFFSIRGVQGTDTYMLPLYEAGTPQPLMASPNYHESQVSTSPDGRWIAYTSNESGRDEVYVRPFPDIQSGRWQVSAGGGREPLWAFDGQQLYYRSGNAIFEVDVITQGAFVASAPQVLVEGTYVAGDYLPSYDVSPDGDRFLLMKDLQ